MRMNYSEWNGKEAVLLCNMSVGLSEVLLNFYRAVVTIRTARLGCRSAAFRYTAHLLLKFKHSMLSVRYEINIYIYICIYIYIYIYICISIV